MCKGFAVQQCVCNNSTVPYTYTFVKRAHFMVFFFLTTNINNKIKHCPFPVLAQPCPPMGPTTPLTPSRTTFPPRPHLWKLKLNSLSASPWEPSPAWKLPSGAPDIQRNCKLLSLPPPQGEPRLALLTGEGNCLFLLPSCL